MQFPILRLLLGVLCATLAQSAVNHSFYESSEKNDIKIELWLESNAPTWDAMTLCYAITNRRKAVYLIPADSGNGCPITYLNIKDQAGKSIRRAQDYSGKILYFEPGASTIGICWLELRPNETLIVHISIKNEIKFPNPENGTIEMTWNNQGSDPLGLNTLTAKVKLPPSPLMIPSTITYDKVRTLHDLGARLQRLDDGLPATENIDSATGPPRKETGDPSPISHCLTEQNSTSMSRNLELPSRVPIPSSRTWLVWVTVLGVAISLLWMILRRHL
ncbi:MAG: hypothetical protein K1X78_28260 [Verrucomicrobiaceae bacterium]|nr:hypothetical protein [Verrucomicrobiaceae bacterium]